MKKSSLTSMAKIWIEVCLISARGLPRSSLWKFQWYAVGWIDPNNKYCTKIDTSGNQNPVWNTKFTHLIDISESKMEDIVLNVEVYSRENLFLREKLQGIASVNLKEFLVKFSKNCEGLKEGSEDLGSFQLRKKNSDKPQGFIDVSIRISQEKEGTSSYFFLGNEDGFNLKDGSRDFTHPPAQTEQPFYPPGNPRPPITIQNRPYNHPMPYPTNYSQVSGPNYPTNASRPSYPPTNYPGYPPPSHPQQPPPSYVGYTPTFLPRSNDPSTSSSYINLPSSGVGRGGGPGPGPGFGVGLGAGALAAGAVIFGDDLMSGFELPSVEMRDASLTIATDPLF